MDDTLLARKAAIGDWEALAILLDRHRATMFRIAYGELGRYEDAQDAVAEAMVRACKYSHRLKQSEQFAVWLRVLVRNEARRIGKKNAAYQERVSQYGAQATGGDISPNHLQQTVRHTLAQLPTDLAQVTVRFYLHGESIREIARAIERPEGTVKWMLSRSRARLADLLEEDFAMEISTSSSYRAVIVAPNISATERQEIVDAVKEAGWNSVDVIADATQALAFTDSQPTFLGGQQLIILDEQIGSTSAFELVPLLVAARKQHDFALWVLLREGRNENAKKVAAMAAYVSGVDFLLTRPFPQGELVAFARHVRQTLSLKG